MPMIRLQKDWWVVFLFWVEFSQIQVMIEDTYQTEKSLYDANDTYK